jgi:hypothetical protein
MGVQKHYKKNVLQKNRVKKFLPKSRPKNPQTDFFSNLFYHAFGRFSVRGAKKHGKKCQKM